jgi:hypothetical protein
MLNMKNKPKVYNYELFLVSFMIVDFLISEINVVIEVLGPSHFIKPDQNELNLNTQFKNKCL